MTKTALLKSTVFGAAAIALMALAAPASAADIGACLITKTDTNPFFVKMKEGATAKANELGVQLKAYAGKIDGDNESQVAAIESRALPMAPKGSCLFRRTPRRLSISEKGTRCRHSGDRARHAARADRRR